MGSSNNLWRVIDEELTGLHPRLMVALALMAPLPPFVGSRVRVRLLRAAGFEIGRGSVIWGRPTITGSRNPERHLTIGEDCVVSLGCLLDTSAPIVIGDDVSIGQQVTILTNAHEIAGPTRRAGALKASPVSIGTGAWLSTRVTVLPGVTIGPGAVVAAGAVVHRDVLAHTLVAGVPARLVRHLDHEPSVHDS